LKISPLRPLALIIVLVLVIVLVVVLVLALVLELPTGHSTIRSRVTNDPIVIPAKAGISPGIGVAG
jgi:hypothetical protein